MLAELLTRAQSFGIDTAHAGNTNHLPMALIALAKLGANRRQLEGYYAKYAPSLIAKETTRLDANFNWRENLGDKSQFDNYLAYFLAQLEGSSVELTLKRHLGRLMSGCGASAFHAIIRLSYGLQQNNDVEVAFGLADLASNYLPIDRGTHTDKSCIQVLTDALEQFKQIDATGGLISARMKSIVCRPQFYQANCAPEEMDLAQISKLVADLYLQTRDFTVLHAVTSCHAMRYLLPYLNQPTKALQFYWAAVIAAVLSVEYLDSKVSPTNPAKSLSELNFDAALNSQDSHVIKLVWSCLDEYRHYGFDSHLLILNVILSEG